MGETGGSAAPPPGLARVLDLVRRLISVSGRDVEPEVQGSTGPRDEINRRYLDSSAVREELGWQPRWDLDAGLGETFSWYQRSLS